MPSGRDLLVAELLILPWPAAAQEAPTDATQPEQLPPVVVVETTPVPALGTPIAKYPGNVQSITATEIQDQNPLDISSLLNRNVGSVTNARYATAGALNWNAFADPISVQRFLAPGTPIGGWGGIKVRF